MYREQKNRSERIITVRGMDRPATPCPQNHQRSRRTKLVLLKSVILRFVRYVDAARRHNETRRSVFNTKIATVPNDQRLGT